MVSKFGRLLIINESILMKQRHAFESTPCGAVLHLRQPFRSTSMIDTVREDNRLTAAMIVKDKDREELRVGVD